jgi:sporulation protein YlmC with PRC-barrel domain
MKKKMTTFAIGVGLACLPFVSLSYGEQTDQTMGSDRSSQSSDQFQGDQPQSGDQDRSQQRRGSRDDYPGLERQSRDQSSDADQRRSSSDQMQSSDRDSQRRHSRGDSSGMRSNDMSMDSDQRQSRSSDSDASAGNDAKRAATKPGDTDMTNTKGEVGAVPDKYTILPVARGKKVEVNNEMIGDTVQNTKGEKLGTIEELIMDSQTRKIEYAMIQIGETDQLRAFPWSAFKVDKKNGNVVLNMTKEQLQPGLASTDQSPDLRGIEKELKTLRERESRRSSQRQGLGVTEEPAAAGPMGESQVGGGGPSGPRALPPGPAPSFKGGN